MTMRQTLLACILITDLGGCAVESSVSPYGSHVPKSRDSLRAQELTQRATAVVQDDPQLAEELLRKALGFDLYFGPAHNNLGVLHLKQSRLYEAASEFEWARKLMPGHPDPRMNLALTLENAGKIDDALCTYATALDVYPGHIPSMQALARLQIRSGRTDDQTQQMLHEIGLAGETLEWRDWAKKQAIWLESKEEHD